MLLLLDINAIFDIEEEDMIISDGSNYELDNVLDSILDVTDGIGQTWKTRDDNNTTNNKSETEKFKTYDLPVSEYLEWIKNLEKEGLSYYRNDYQVHEGGSRKKNQWSEKWYCHRYGTYESTARKNVTKRPRLVQKESKKCESHKSLSWPAVRFVYFTSIRKH
ncbi:16397_t:CDS:2 [Cetraspora pellucida]|uniref:16397_t:CDS:1 n=1 Tax=Cetraspora pellucida TaxID=1433469 RepID=A0A9N9JCJ0_9GLOM|nr:16397_t:CDS:2 [Cetraspora pellucida]